MIEGHLDRDAGKCAALKTRNTTKIVKDLLCVRF